VENPNPSARRAISMINNKKYAQSLIDGSGYDDTAMALGELIDNSIQAKAKNVDVMVAEAFVRAGTGKRRSWQVHEMAVLDDGIGMNPSLLQRALTLGDGDHHMESEGMGKFGVGLPQASISQAKRVDVWSWKDGLDSAKHAFIDLSDEDWLDNFEVQYPDDEPIPQKWLDNSNIQSKAGTLVVWSICHGLSWVTAAAIQSNSEFLVGRMYRNWLTTDNKEGIQRAKIRLVAFDHEQREERPTTHYKANDPLYLLSKSSGMKSTTKRKIRFEKFGDPVTLDYLVTLTKQDDDGNEYNIQKEEQVTLNFSLAPKELREPYNGTLAGNLDYGRHAKKNTGVSIMRAGRELKLESKFITNLGKDPRNRWMGASIEFSPGLDKILGVTNDKQDAKKLVSVADQDWEDFADGKETALQIKERLKDSNYDLYVRLDIATNVRKHLNQMRQMIERTPVQTTKPKKVRHSNTPERKGTEATKIRQEETGKITASDEEEKNLSKGERISRIEDFLDGIDADNKTTVLGDIKDSGLKYSFAHAFLDTDAFFTVDGVAGSIIITLNRSHAAYKELFQTLAADTENMTPEQINEMLKKANMSLLIMMIAWSRLEDEASGGAAIRLKDTRSDWGRMSRDFLLFGKE
tara:strand:- start:9934 stop:11832 length:1899 start_codon:yes stop_codon:yes gene_type:complete